ncbi:hypothetical protein SDC9_90727 [bioreactor metagenome]|uniref:Uncharacterized protein n=1 Tax=bioreactor metagenome TaxID=1076179 RepID=A0A644ZSR9_9ZZZZ
MTTNPSTGTFAPVLTNKISPTSTSSTSTSTNSPSSIFFSALSGAISVNSLIAERVWFKVRCSKKAPNKNKKVTMADSSKFRMKNAPLTAMVTSTSILTTFTFKAWYACIAMGAIPNIEARMKLPITMVSLCKNHSLINPKAISTPLTKTMGFFLLKIHRCMFSPSS